MGLSRRVAVGFLFVFLTVVVCSIGRIVGEVYEFKVSAYAPYEAPRGTPSHYPHVQ